MTNLPKNAILKHLRSSLFVAPALLPVLVIVTAIFAASPAASAQTSNLHDRISAAIDNNSRSAVTGSQSPRAAHSNDVGTVPGNTPLTGIVLAFSRTAAQQADLQSLLAAQQDPTSSSFHQWLTPAQFGARFGVSDADLSATEAWLQSQGFTIDSVSPARNSISFSGNASSVESAFGAPLHYFKGTNDTITHMAPAHDITLPTSLSSVILGVAGLSDYKPRSHVILKAPQPAFTSSQTGSHFIGPLDVAKIYDFNTAYSAGYTGLGQTIVVAGQTEVLASDIANFQSAAATPSNTPSFILVPGTGSAAFFSGDEAESDLDLEYTSSMAYKATIDFVYTGGNSTLGVFGAVIYAIQQDMGNIITLSYGECEPDLGSYYYGYFDSFFQQAAAQGQSIVNSSGDSGSTACYGDGNTTTYQEQLAVSYPASSAYVTGVGGTEFTSAAVATGNSTYFTAANGSDVYPSAVGAIPEQAWNDDSASLGLSSGGGGVSIYGARPSWQAGVTGIPSGNYRLVPDVSLDASPNNAGYLYCSSDYNSTGITGSCSNGFRNSSSTSLTVAGGTSFAAPIFAAVLAIINQAKGYTTGQGLVGPSLYPLAANSATYATAFRDTISGGNECLAGTAYCSGLAVSEYLTTTGYDEATGLGSVDVSNLVTAWPKNTAATSTLLKSAVTAAPNNSSPAVSTTDAITLQITCAAGALCTGATATGTVTVTDTVNSATTTPAGSPITLTNGAAVYTYTTPSAGGIHQLVFTYSGNGTYASSKTTVFLDVASATFSMAGTATTVASSGGTSTATITVTPTNGYTGTVQLNLVASSSLTNTCYSGPYSVSVGGTSAVTATYTLYTGVTACPSGAYPLVKAAGSSTPALRASKAPAAPRSPWNSAPLPATLAGLLVLGCWKRRSRLLRVGIALGMVLVLGLSGLGLTGCSSGASGNTTTTGTTGSTYALEIYGNDSVDQAIITSAAFSVTVN